MAFFINRYPPPGTPPGTLTEAPAVEAAPLMEADLVKVQQVSFFLSSTFLISFCEGDFVPYQQTVKRLQGNVNRLRSRKSDCLLYSLLDVVVDQGFPVLESFRMQLGDLEELILECNDGDTLGIVHTVKRELILLRRMLWPQR